MILRWVLQISVMLMLTEARCQNRSWKDTLSAVLRDVRMPRLLIMGRELCDAMCNFCPYLELHKDHLKTIDIFVTFSTYTRPISVNTHTSDWCPRYGRSADLLSRCWLSAMMRSMMILRPLCIRKREDWTFGDTTMAVYWSQQTAGGWF